MENKCQFKGLDFGSYCWIEQKRYVGENENYRYKVIGRLHSSASVRVPVDHGANGTGLKETGHKSFDEPCLYVVCDGLQPKEVIKVRVQDVKISKDFQNGNRSSG